MCEQGTLIQINQDCDKEDRKIAFKGALIINVLICVSICLTIIFFGCVSVCWQMICQID